MNSSQELERLSVRLVGDGSSYVKMLRTAMAATDNAAAKIKKAGRSFKSLGTKMTLGITLPVAGMVKGFADFDDAMTKSTAIMSGVTENLRKEMEKTAYTISRNSVTSATELAKSYYYLASAGLDAERAIKALPVVEKFAVAGAFDMAEATDLLTDAQSALGLSFKDSEENMRGMLKVADILVRANTLANASVQQFSESLTNEAGAAIKQYNMDLEEGVAILATYADQGLKGDAAGSMFGRMVRLLIKSINDNRDAFKEMNIDVEEFANTGKNLTKVIEGITRAVDGLGPAQKAAALETLGFEARIQQAVLPLLGATDKIRAYEAELRKAGGYTNEVANKQLVSFSSQLKILWNRVKEASDLIGKELAPYIKALSDRISSLIEWFRGLDAGTKHTIAIMAGLAAIFGPLAIAIGSVTIAVGLLITSFTNITRVVLKVMAALKGTTKEATKTTASMETMAAATTTATASMASMGTAAGTTALALGGLTTSVGLLTSATTAMTTTMGSTALTMGRMRTAAAGLDDVIDVTATVISSSAAATVAAEGVGTAVAATGATAVLSLLGWVAAIGLVLTAFAGLVAYVRGKGSFTAAIKGAGAAVADFAKKSIGFIYNIKENWGIWMDWVSQNWEMLYRDMGQVVGVFIGNTIKNIGVFIETGLRLFELWAGFLAQVWESVFNGDMIHWAMVGVQRVADIFVELFKGLWEGLKAAFTSGDSTTLANQVADLGEQLSKDFATGFNTNNVLKSAADIMGEQINKLHSPLEGFKSNLPQGGPAFNYAYGKGAVQPVANATEATAAATKEAAGAAKEVAAAAGGLPANVQAAIDGILKGMTPDTLLTAPTGLDKDILDHVDEMLGIKKPEGTDTKKDKVNRTGEFKQMSLNQFSINPVGGSRKETQQVSDVGVQNKLDQFMNLVRGQKPVSVLGR